MAIISFGGTPPAGTQIGDKTLYASQFSGLTNEAKITAAIARAVEIGALYVYVPANMLPYDATKVTFNTAVRMVREGGDPTTFDVKAYGAAGDGTTDDTQAIVRAIDAAKASQPSGFNPGADPVILPSAIYIVSSQIVLPSGVQVVGRGGSFVGPTLRAKTTFPTNTPLVRLGDGTALVFNTRLERVNIDCNDVAGSTGIFSDCANEGSGVRDCFITSYLNRGIDFSDSITTANANWTIERTAISCSNTAGAAATTGIYIDRNGKTGPGLIHKVSVNILSGAALQNVGIHLHNTSGNANVTIISADIEHYADGIRLEANALACIVSASFYNCTSGVHIINGARVAAFALFQGGGTTNTVTDDSQGTTDASFIVPSYVTGGGALAPHVRAVSGATITPSMATAKSFLATLTTNATIAAPTSPVSGQRLTITFLQDSTGGRTVIWNAVFKVSWSDTGNVANARSTISFVYDGTNWNQDGAQTPYV